MGIKWPFGKIYQVKCSDGTVKTVYKRVEDAFPLYIPGWEGKININLAVLQNLPAELKAAYATKIQGLLFSLDELNHSLMMSFRGAYIAYQNNPCENTKFFERQIEKLLQEQHHLRTIKIQVQGLISLAEVYQNNADKFLLLYKEIVDQLRGPSELEAASLEIAEIQKLIKKIERI